MQRSLFGREPALWINVVAAVLGLIVTFGWKALDAQDATNIVAVLTGLAAVVTAVQTRPWAVPVFTGFVSTAAVLLAGYGLEVSQQSVGAVQLVVVSVLTLLARGQITPAADPRTIDGAVVK